MVKKQIVDPYTKELQKQITTLREQIKEIKKKIAIHESPAKKQQNLTIVFD
jgi:hypothetical protein